jgi:hypothetical protein
MSREKHTRPVPGGRKVAEHARRIFDAMRFPVTPEPDEILPG